jgi:hypothetical protein
MADNSFSKKGNPSKIARAIQETAIQIRDKVVDRSKRAQTTLGSFFTKPTPPHAPPATEEESPVEPDKDVESEETESSYVLLSNIWRNEVGPIDPVPLQAPETRNAEQQTAALPKSTMLDNARRQLWILQDKLTKVYVFLRLSYHIIRPMTQSALYQEIKDLLTLSGEQTCALFPDYYFRIPNCETVLENYLLKDIFVWAPESLESKPIFPNCNTSEKVTRKGFLESVELWFGRDTSMCERWA